MAQDYNKKIQITRKALNILKKDIQYRDQQVLRNQPTFDLDAEINGQFLNINEELQTLQISYQNIEAKAKELGLMQRQVDKRRQALNVNIEEKNKLKKMYDESVNRRIPNTRAAQQADNRQKFEKEYKNKDMSKQEHLNLKQRQEDLQDEKIGNLTNIVKQMKGGQKQISGELDLHDKLMDAGMDENMEDMSKIRRNLNKLLQKSSYWCLVTIIICQVAGIICNLLLWSA